MKYSPKSPRIFSFATIVGVQKSWVCLGILFALVLVGLTGCADTAWPTWLTGEPDDAVLHAPRAVGRPPSDSNENWPSLGNVPAKPKDYSTGAERQKQIRKLEKAKAEAEAIKERVDETPMPPTLASPGGSSPVLALPPSSGQP